MKHDWIAIVTHSLTEDEVRRAMTSSSEDPVMLGSDTIKEIMIGCFVCEQTAHEAIDLGCPGEPSQS